MCLFSIISHVTWFTFLRLVSLQWPHKFSTVVKKYSKVLSISWIIATVISSRTKFFPIIV